MLEKIIDTNDRKFSDLKKLQDSGAPLIMYGAGSYALDVSKFLQRHGLTVNDYCIDADYVKPRQIINGKNVRSLQEVYDKYDSMNIVIGFSDYKKARMTLTALGEKAELFFIDAPNQLGFFDHKYLEENREFFEKTYELLSDQKSKDIFIAFLNAKVSGDPSYLYENAEFNQYFNDLVRLTKDEVFVDCGAYDGDTIAQFVKATEGNYKKIFAFEPDADNQQALLHYIDSNQFKDVTLIKAGSWSSEGTVRFSSDGNMSSASDTGDTEVPVRTIDSVVGDEQVTYIKMDIEGAELESLKGASQTIINNMPKLAICAYHKPEDLIQLPQYILGLSAGYDLYLRHHQHMSWEMVLYAIPKA